MYPAMSKTPNSAGRFSLPRLAPTSWVLHALFAVLALLLFRPYLGITHDARLYVGYALASLDPTGIGTDIMFQHDGQSRYSLFPVPFLWLVGWLGPGQAALLATYAGLMLWAIALVAWLEVLLKDTTASHAKGWVVLVVVALPAFYGGSSVFQFAEQFVSPRVFAEAGIVGALACAMARRWVGAVVLSGVALAVHPIMAAPGVALVAWSALERPRSQQVATAALLVLLVLVAAGTWWEWAPARLFARFDPEWRAALDRKQALVFISHWKPEGWARMVLHVCTLMLGRQYVPASVKRLFDGALLIGAVGVVTAYVVGDRLGNVLVTQGQPWRGLWLVALLAVVAFGTMWVQVAAQLRQPETPEDELRVSGVLLLALAWVAIELNSNAAVIGGLAVFVWTLPRTMPTMALPQHGYRVLAVAVGAIAIGIVVAKAVAIYRIVFAAPDPRIWRMWFYHLNVGVPQLLLLASAALTISSDDGGRQRAASQRNLDMLAFLLVLAVVWDSRYPYQHSIERELADRMAHVPPPIDVVHGGTVFWLDGDLEAWAFTGRAGWGTVLQGISGVFDRELSLRWDRRWALLDRRNIPMGESQLRAVRETQRTPLTTEDVASICQDPESPFAIVVPSDLLNTTQTTFTPKVPKLLAPISADSSWRSNVEYGVISCKHHKQQSRDTRLRSDRI